MQAPRGLTLSALLGQPRAILLAAIVLGACSPGTPAMDQTQLTDFATRYAAAWSSQDPDRLTAFYAEEGSLQVNAGEAAVGRAAVRETVEGFMNAFPDMVVRLDSVLPTATGATFHWTWTGTNTGPGGTGSAVRIQGYEEWTLAPGNLITQSLGYYDEAEYQRQMREGAPAALQLPSVTLPAELERVLRDYERAWGSRDVAALVGLFTEDGFVLQPGHPPVRGHTALTERYTGQGGGPLKLRALAYAMADTVGYIIGAYGYGDTPADQGKFTLTLRRSADGRWLIASDMDNGSAPPRGLATPPDGAT